MYSLYFQNIKKQVNSLLGLWKYVKPNGGVYVVEDMHTSFPSMYNDNPESSYDVLMKLISMRAMTNSTSSSSLDFILDELRSVNCFFHACALVKK